MKILGLGTVAMDVLMEVDRLPVADSFGIINRVSYVPGGSGTNVIVQAAKLGAQTAYIAKLGDDAIGQDILESLKESGVAVNGMRVKEHGTSLHTNIVIAQDGEKFILLNLGDAFGALKQNEVDDQLIDDCDVFFTDFFPYKPALYALKRAKEAGKTTVFNMQTGMSTFQGFGMKNADILAMLQYVDIFAPCQEGLADLFGSTDLEAILPELRSHFKGMILSTRGSDGVLAIDAADKRVHVPGMKIKAVDTTGAGDTFIGSFMVAYFQDRQPLTQALQTANACAAYTCMYLGARSGPNREQLSSWINQ